MPDPPSSPTPRDQPPTTSPAPPAGPPAGTPPTAGPPAPSAWPARTPPAAPGAGGGARWGEPGYQGSPDPDRQSRLAVAWIVGILGALGLAVVALGGFALLYSMGRPAPVVEGPFPTTAPQPTVAPPTPGQDPTSPTNGAGTEPPGDGGGSRTSNAFYSIRIPDGFRDVTASYRTQHPAESSTVQALAGRPDAAVTPDAGIVISRLPSGADRGRSLDRLAEDQVRALRRQGASGVGTPRHSSIGPDPAIEVDLTIRSGGRAQRRTQVLCLHDGRLWEIAVTGPSGSRSLVTAAWNTVKTGWQWR